MKEEYLQRIVYKKSAYSEMQNDLQIYYQGKNVLIVTTKSLVDTALTSIFNAVSLAKCSFSHFIAKNNFEKNELDALKKILCENEFDLLIVLGSGTATNVVRYFANVFCLPFFVCPTAPTTANYFTDTCFNPYEPLTFFKADFAERIYICEKVIKQSNLVLAKQGLMYVFSFYESIVSSKIDAILFDTKTSCVELEELCKKTESETFNIISGDCDSKLVLMDILIELGFILSNTQVCSATSNLFLTYKKTMAKGKQNISSGYAMLLCSVCILNAYSKLFCTKIIEFKDFPNYNKVAKFCANYDIVKSKLNNISYFKTATENKMMIKRLNNLSEEFLYQTNAKIKAIKNNLDAISLKNDNFQKNIDLSVILSCFGSFAFFTKNSYLVNVLAYFGYLNYL